MRGAHTRVTQIEPRRAAITVTSAIVALLAFGVVAAALLYPTDAWPQRWRFRPEVSARTPPTTAGIAGVIGVAFLAQAVVNGRRWRIAWIVERLSKRPAFASLIPDTAWVPAPHRAAAIPPLDVEVRTRRKVPKLSAKPRAVTGESNVIGERPLKIAYLRLFENQPRARTFLEGAWREFGCVYLLRSAESVTPAEYRRAKRSKDVAGLFISSSEQLLPALEGGAFYRKGRHKLTTTGAKTVRVRDKYGSYSVEAFLCHGQFWKSAVDLLLDRVDLAVLDLSGFRRQNVGAHYELQRLVDRVPVQRVVFLVDPWSDKRFIDGQIRNAWSHMAAGSPNASPGPRVAWVFETDRIARSQSAQAGGGGGGGQVHVRLIARRRETRRVAAMAQARLGG